MQRQLIAAVTAIFLLTPAAYADSKVLDAAGFTGVDIASGIRADIAIGPAFSVVAESPKPDDLTDLRFSVNGGKFHASYDWDFFSLFNVRGRETMLHITLPKLDSIEVSSGVVLTAAASAGDALSVDASSGATVTITAAAAKSYSIDASSGASVSIAGTCQSLSADLSSGANVDAKGLDCADATINASSGAHAQVAVRSSITVDASSGAGIEVSGSPSVKTLDTNSGASVSFVAG